MQTPALKKFSWFLFGYTIIVILWGAWVRISHSGNGCGDSWPLCNGEVLPNAQRIKTLVEFSHRLTSGLFGVFVVLLFFLIRKSYSKGSPQRFFSGLALILTITEALLGAKLVLSGLVAQNESPLRLAVMSLHQLNSFLLTGFIFLTARSLSSPGDIYKNKMVFFLPLLFLLISMSGAIAALASTLFPSQSLWEGLVSDFSSNSGYLLRLRILHPTIAMTFSAIFIFLLYRITNQKSVTQARIFQQTYLGFLAMLTFGSITLLSLSPLWMKLTHLAMAHLLWALLLRYTASLSTSNE